MRYLFALLLVFWLLWAVPSLALTDTTQVNLTVTPGSSGGCVSDCAPPPPPPAASTTPPTPVPAEAPLPVVGGLVSQDIFDILPDASAAEMTKNFALADISFSQLGEPVTTFDQQNLVVIKGQKYLTIEAPAAKLPPVLKTIGVTIFDANKSGETLSFVLHLDDTEHAYRATLAPFARDGLYPVNIHLLNYADQRLRKFTGSLQVAGVGALGIGTTDALDQFKLPLQISSGLLAGASSLLAVTAGASIYDAYSIILRGLTALWSYLGFRKKRRPWGTVYDAVTKRPIDPAYISVRQHGQEVASAITDIDGRYSLFLPPGKYQFVVNKSHYHFPSLFLQGRNNDELYNNLYFGGEIEVVGDEAATYNIPLDPVDFDWNEFAKNRWNLFKLYSHQQLTRVRVTNIIYGVGLSVTMVSLAFLPNYFNVAALLVYILLYIFTFRHGRRRLLKIRRESTGEPVPFSIIRFFLADIHQEVKSVVADEFGRFNVLLRPGSYYLVIDEKEPDGSYRRIYQSEVVSLSNGLWPEDVIVPDL
jgi:hypothetical protein